MAKKEEVGLGPTHTLMPMDFLDKIWYIGQLLFRIWWVMGMGFEGTCHDEVKVGEREFDPGPQWLPGCRLLQESGKHE